MIRRTLKYTRALEIDSEFTHLSSDEHNRTTKPEYRYKSTSKGYPRKCPNLKS